MEQILNKLSEIETTANGIMEEADKKKQELSSEMEETCRAFDNRLEQETEQEIQKIRQELERQKDVQLTDLLKNTEEGFAQLDSYYEKNHTTLSRELFQKIIEM